MIFKLFMNWNRLPIPYNAFDVALYGCNNLAECIINGVACTKTARQIGNGNTIIAVRVFVYHNRNYFLPTYAQRLMGRNGGADERREDASESEVETPATSAAKDEPSDSTTPEPGADVIPAGDRAEDIRHAVTEALAVKYGTKASEKWVKGFAKPARVLTTVEFVPE